MTDVISRMERTDTYPKPTFPARYDLEAWCYHYRHAKGETGEAARFVLDDMQRGCWPETRRLESFHQAHHGRGATGRENLFIQHLLVDHGAGLDSPLVRMIADAHRQYLRDLQEFWKQAERIPGPAPALDEVLDPEEVEELTADFRNRLEATPNPPSENPRDSGSKASF